MKSVLVVDDEPDVAQVIAEAIEHGIADSKCVVMTDFDEAVAKIPELRPDAIVLDLMEGSKSNSLSGQRTWQAVWGNRFCPIVIHTAWEGELVPPIPSDHPFVKVVIKGLGTEARVVAELIGFDPGLAAIESLRLEVDQVIHRVLRDTAGEGVIECDDPSQLLHAGRRRIAASMDEPTETTETALQSWEQYLLPPIGESPLTGDILRKREEDWDSATGYRLVLTPSCDMVKGRKPCSILVARCEPAASLKHAMSLPTARDRAESRLVKEALTQGVWNGWVPLPEFPRRIPHMAANLKDLEVIKFEDVCADEPATSAFVRVASIDSPFREQIAWAFLTTVARPGMPDRDFQAWACGFLDSAASNAAPTPARETS